MTTLAQTLVDLDHLPDAPRPTAPAMSVLSGCDVVDVERLSATLDRRDGFLERVFTSREILDSRRGGVQPGSDTERSRLAARFAAKEATRKALGDLRLGFHATEVRTAQDGSPHLYLDGEPSDLTVSLSHDGGVAMAVVTGIVARDRHLTPPRDVAVPVAGRVSLDLTQMDL